MGKRLSKQAPSQTPKALAGFILILFAAVIASGCIGPFKSTEPSRSGPNAAGPSSDGSWMLESRSMPPGANFKTPAFAKSDEASPQSESRKRGFWGKLFDRKGNSKPSERLEEQANAEKGASESELEGATPGPEWNEADQADRPDQDLLKPQDDFFTLGPGDRLEIEVLGEPETRALTPVGPDGRIYYHVLPGLDVWGLTLSEARSLLERKLEEFYQKTPRVTLILREVGSKRVWLLGRLASPGIYPMTSPMTLLEAVSMAGGLSESVSMASSAGGGFMSMTEETRILADLERGFVIRRGGLLPVDFEGLLLEGDLTQNVSLQPGDFVYLPSRKSQEVYVLGAVLRPAPVRYRKGLTVMAAVAQAGGPLDEAHESQIAVVRGSLTSPKIAVVDFKAISRGEGVDVPLEPRDIVYVPLSPYRKLFEYADLVINTFARTIGINEGARAVTRRAAPVGVNVPITSP